MKIGVDTNLLIPMHDQGAPDQERVKAAVDSLVAQGHRLVVGTQALAEFYSVVTNPRRVARPLSPDAAQQVCDGYLTSSEIDVVSPTPQTCQAAIRHAAQDGIRGPHIFDIQLAYALLAVGVQEIHTRNVKDFAGIEGLRVVDPLA